MKRSIEIKILFTLTIIIALVSGFLGAGVLIKFFTTDDSAPTAPPPVYTATQDIVNTALPPSPTLSPTPATSPTPSMPPLSGIKIGIDAGHQAAGNFDMEPVAPGSSERKYKVSSGTAGRFTNVPEHEVNLAVALLLQAKLEALGSETVMVRTSKDVDISNVERATMMNDAGVDLCIRIHADGSEQGETVNGASMLLPANECTAGIYGASRAAGTLILDEFIKATGAKNLGLFDRRDLSGFNWSTVPVVLIELGFMTNKAEDELLVTAAYQEKCAAGLTSGILAYFEDTGTGLSSLNKTLEDFLSSKEFSRADKWAVHIIDAQSGDSAIARFGDAEEPTIAASLIKLFIAGALFHEETVNADFKLDADALAKLEKMLRDSENVPANELVTLLGSGDFGDGAKKVNAFAKSIGCGNTELNRKFVTTSGEATQGENYTSVADCATALQLLARGEFVDKTTSDQIYSWLRADATWNQNKAAKIRAGIVAVDSRAVVANKTGENSPPSAPCFVENDIAVVSFGETQYIICIMSNSSDSNAARDTIKQLAELTHRFFLGGGQ